MNIGACAVCVNTEVDLIHIDYGHLRELYNNVCGFQTEFVNGPPSYICRFCASLIKKFNNFKDQCQASIQASQELFAAIQENTGETLVIDRSNVCILPTLSYAQPEKLVYQETEIENSHITKVSQPKLKNKNKSIPSFQLQILNKTSKSSKETIKAVASIKNVMGKDWDSKLGENDHSSFSKPDLFHNFTDIYLNENNENVQEIIAENSSFEDTNNYLANVFQENTNNHVLLDINNVILPHSDVNDILIKDDRYVPDFIEKKKNVVPSMDKYIKLVPMNRTDAMAAFEIKLAIMKKHNDKIDKKLVCNICQRKIYTYNTISHFLSHEKKNACMFCEICKLNLSDASLSKHNDWYHNYKFICKICSEVNFSIPDASQHFVSYHRIEKDKLKALTDEFGVKEEMHKRDRTFANKSSIKRNEQNIYVYFSKILYKLIGKVKKKASKKPIKKDSKGRIAHLGILGSHFTRELCTPEEQYQEMEDRKKSMKYQLALYKCELCFKISLSEEKLMNHYKEHSPSIGRYKCDICKKYIPTRAAIIKHFRSRHNYRYKCKLCDFQTLHVALAFSHKSKHLNQKLSCNMCNREFNTRSAMYSHKRYAHPSMAVCNLCGEGFGTEHGLKSHRMRRHKSPLEREQIEKLMKEKDINNEFYCKECDLQFLNKDAFNKHLISSGMHTALNHQFRKEARKALDQYRISTKIINSDKTRQTIQTDQSKTKLKKPRIRKAYVFCRKCTVCGLEFKNTTFARFHYKKYHPNDEYYLKTLMKTYKCDLCDFSSLNQCSVYSHKTAVHSTERPFKCPHCDMTFKVKQNMVRHNLTHTGERPFECAHCNKRFGQKVTVQLHIQTVHLKIPYPPWQNKNKRNKEKRKFGLKKTTNKQKNYVNEVEQEVVEEDNEYYLEGQELATDYIMKDNLVYSTSSSENSDRVRAISMDTQTKRYRQH